MAQQHIACHIAIFGVKGRHIGYVEKAQGQILVSAFTFGDLLLQMNMQITMAEQPGQGFRRRVMATLAIDFLHGQPIALLFDQVLEAGRQACHLGFKVQHVRGTGFISLIVIGGIYFILCFLLFDFVLDE